LADVNEFPDPLFQDDETLQVTITGPLTSLVRERSKDDYRTGLFEYVENDGTDVEFDLDIRARGNFRHEYCEFPPVTLNFKKSQTNATLFDNQNKLKLVIQCDRSESYEQAVLREYLAYRIFNTITDKSFRVRLLRITYHNTETQEGGQLRYAFLIEHKNRLAERLDLRDLEIKRAEVESMQADQLNLTSVFGFFLGNTDFSPVVGPGDEGCCHNYVQLGNDVDPMIPVPYDFDQSGFVSAPYAKPDPRLGIRNVRQRLYRGRCVNNDHIAESLDRFRDRRDSVYALINEQKGLDAKVRKTVVSYVDDFYELIDNPKWVESRIYKKCI